MERSDLPSSALLNDESSQLKCPMRQSPSSLIPINKHKSTRTSPTTTKEKLFAKPNDFGKEVKTIDYLDQSLHGSPSLLPSINTTAKKRKHAAGGTYDHPSFLSRVSKQSMGTKVGHSYSNLQGGDRHTRNISQAIPMWDTDLRLPEGLTFDQI